MDNSIHINLKNNQSDTTIASQNDTRQNQLQKRKEIEDVLNLDNTQEKSIRIENEDKPSISIHISTDDFDKRSATTTIVDNKNFNYCSKYFILTLISIGSMFMPISCTITYPAAEEIRAEFKVNDMVNGLPISCFLISFGIFPLIWASYSDKHQTRKQVYVAGLILLIIASIICAISKNIWVYILMRALQACGVAVVVCIGGGIICDIFPDHERGQAYGIFSFGRETGGLIGPVIGGLITSSLGWRFNFWLLTILSGVFVPLIIFFLPETFPQPLSKFLPNITFSSTGNHSLTSINCSDSIHRANSTPSIKAISIKAASIVSTIKTKQFNPMAPLTLLIYPNVALLSFSKIIMTITIYIQNLLIGDLISTTYGLSSSSVGLIYIVPGLGCMIGSIIGGKYQDWVIERYRKKNNLTSELPELPELKFPEIRIKSCWIGIILIPLSYFLIGVTLEKNIPIYWILISLFVGSFASEMIFNLISTYLVDAYPERSASAIAVSDCLSYIFTGIILVFVSSVKDILNPLTLFSSMGGVSILSGLFLIIVEIKGKSWRNRFN
ncbi:major facilitator superfamily domain-containing protein [Rhizophagus clarus]|uniref:Major facilitator superfamily domain-containing protein n=1 Tax=Rhizophagus clarus TaxID=94130 RepID=A0A8H3QQW3_9GLOM|nr:major facilitator superfamily domain-containing protein [Rhizophagus clarus]